ncbi:hypothetical protein [Alloactinosynnema sp. L-07]|nr:hypothetical protein [Alloactinosynnema sp. L-07]
MTDEEVIARYNEQTTHTVIGTGFWLDEMTRRSFRRATEAALEEAAAARRLAKINMWVAIVAIVASVGTGVIQIVTGS